MVPKNKFINPHPNAGATVSWNEARRDCQLSTFIEVVFFFFQSVISPLTCLQAVVLRAVDRRVLGPATRPVTHRVGHPVVKADGGGLSQQRVLGQHVGPQAVS